MTARAAAAPQYQRNALAPGILAALILFAAPAVFQTEWFGYVRYAVAILALIVAWFGVQAGQWWWGVVFIVVAVLWNPVVPFAFSGPLWLGGQLIAAVLFLVAASFIRVERDPGAGRR